MGASHIANPPSGQTGSPAWRRFDLTRIINSLSSRVKRQEALFVPPDVLTTGFESNKLMPSFPANHLCTESEKSMSDLYSPSVSPASIPTRRVIDKMDEYMSRLDYAGAERHLHYWLAEARALGDRRGELTMLNELIGHSRKTNQREVAERYSREALALLDTLELKDSVAAGTTYINIATACYVFGEYERSLGYFQEAEAVYLRHGETPPERLGGLYNNMGLTLTALGRWDEAMTAYTQALRQMADVPGGALERAQTCLNMANTLEYQFGAVDAERRINALLDEAEKLLDDPALPRDGYYAYVCDHCAPTFERYGYFLTAKRLKELTKQYYERA